MVIAFISGAFFTLWAGLIITGLLLLKRRTRAALACILEGLLGAGAQVALSTVPVGIGEPIIRIPLPTFWVSAGGGLLVGGAIALALRGLALAPAKGLFAVLAVALIGGGPGLWGFSVLSTPARERERDADRRPIQLPPGFSYAIYARGTIDNPTCITFGPDGALYIADISGTVWKGVDTNGDHVVDSITKWADGFDLALGLAWHKGEMYVASMGKIEALRDTNGDGLPDARRTVIDGLPAMIYKPHSNNSITFGPDGRLYFGIGSTSDNGVEANPRASRIWSVSPDGGDPKVVATGLGNAFDVAFNANGDLFSGDNSGNSPDGPPPDEFNAIVPGGDYGSNYLDVPTGAIQEPLVAYPPHSTPTGLTFYTGTTYPAEYHDNAFMALWSTGIISRIVLTKQANGQYAAQESKFGTGFLYPLDVVNGPDGNLYVADFGASVIYRITYESQTK